MLENDAWLPLADVGKDLVPDAEAERLLGLAVLEALDESSLVQVAPDEDKLAVSLLAILPRGLLKAALEDHVHPLEHKLLLHAPDREHALVAEEVHGRLHVANEAPDVALELADADLPDKLAGAGADGVIVLMFAIDVEELGVHLEDTVELEGANVEDILRVNLGLLAAEDLGVAIDGADAILDLLERLLLVSDGVVILDEVDLVEEDAVGKGELLLRLVFDALGLDLVEVLDDVLCVDEGADAVEGVHVLDVVVDEEGLSDGRGVREAGGLDDDSVKLLNLLVQALEGLNEVPAHSAADATIHNLDHVLISVLLQDRVVDAHLAKLVLDDGEPQAVVLVLEDVVEEGSLARPEETRQNRDRDLPVRLLSPRPAGHGLVDLLRCKSEPAKGGHHTRLSAPPEQKRPLQHPHSGHEG
mmetsp:Transcript_27592/g.70014  ORF Transcript_27592/g.70014 Transcript_27592/m.70014 type:complete len:416 (-) Transcript_27592:227-1474(-)